MSNQAVLLGAILVFAALAGCSDTSAPPPQAEGEGEERRTSQGGPGSNGTDPPHIKVTMLEEPIQLIGASEKTFEVEVPANITNVDATISSPGSAYQSDGLTFELAGCGSSTQIGSSGYFGGPVTRTYRVCKDPATGKHTLTVSGGPASIIDGTLRLVGQQPIGNETAAP